jgi:hypothetical protein
MGHDDRRPFDRAPFGYAQGMQDRPSAAASGPAAITDIAFILIGTSFSFLGEGFAPQTGDGFWVLGVGLKSKRKYLPPLLKGGSRGIFNAHDPSPKT